MMNTQNDTIQSKPKTGLVRLIEIAGTKKWWLFGSMILALLATIAQFVPVIIVFRILIELANNAAVLESIEKSMLYRLAIISLISVAIYGVLFYTANMLSHIAAFNILYEMRVKIAEKLSRLSMGFFTSRNSGEIKKIMTEDVEQVELFVAHHIPDIISAFVFPLMIVGYLFFIDWRLALAALIPLPIAILVQILSFSNKKAYEDYNKALEDINSAVVEYVRGMPVVKVFNASAESFRSLKEAIENYRKMAQKMSDDYSVTFPGFLTVISSSLLFILPTSLLILPHVPSYEGFVPKLLLFLIVGAGIYFPLLKLMYMSNYIQKISVGVEKIDAILSKAEITETEGLDLPDDASVEFENVNFAYLEQNVLSNITFKAEPNTVTALVGPSGAGKTTVGMLAARFWDVTSGSIRIGGIDIRKIKTETLMNRVSSVFQDGFLFYDTIEENIRMGNNTASKEDVIQAAKAAQCHEFITKLDKGYDTLVGEGGTYLSGGEKQRISIARAILKNAPIVILDEATAYADPENEGKILEGFSHLIKDKTVIVIAHRLSTITDADQILVIDEGKIVQRGKQDELVAQDGLYKNMWNTYTLSRQWTIEKKEASK